MSGLKLVSCCAFRFWENVLLTSPLDFAVSKIATRYGVERSYFPNEWGYYFADYHRKESETEIVSLQIPLDSSGNLDGGARLCHHTESYHWNHKNIDMRHASRFHESACNDIFRGLPTATYPEAPNYSYLVMSDLVSFRGPSTR